ncbi:MAG: DUF3828 domain-containing protein [Reyranella sp.]|nr:DUF3828 domain-containing protein [Reyranella sp.]
MALLDWLHGKNHDQAPGVQAQQQTPQAFLEGIYKPYLDKSYRGQNYGQADRFFAPDLVRAMNADYTTAKRRGEVPLLDGDPFVCAQEWEIGKLAVAVSANGAQTAGAKTTGIVTFDNLGKPNRVTLDLVQTPVGWRIDDIACSGDPTSLRALYKLRP